MNWVKWANFIKKEKGANFINEEKGANFFYLVELRCAVPNSGY